MQHYKVFLSHKNGYTRPTAINPSSAVYFAQDYLQAPPGVYFDGGDYSFNTWIWMNSLRSWQRIFDLLSMIA